MHLLVLSAFRPEKGQRESRGSHGLNAPFGAQCFPTTSGLLRRVGMTCLNAPFGAQCFPTRLKSRVLPSSPVSMHLLVLSAFRLPVKNAWPTNSSPSQCTFWCSVLSDSAFLSASALSRRCLNAPFGAQCFPTGIRRSVSWRGLPSQCTFWCSVLSDDMAKDIESVCGWPESQCTFWCSVLSD